MLSGLAAVYRAISMSADAARSRCAGASVEPASRAGSGRSLKEAMASARVTLEHAE